MMDLLMICAATAVLLALAVPSTARIRELAKRSLCGTNLAGIGAACKVYAASNNERWPVPAFKGRAIDAQHIDYLPGNTSGCSNCSGGVGSGRMYESTSETPMFQNAGSTQLSVTRSYWLLARTGTVPLKQFICPSNSHDAADPTEDVESYYDFTGYRNISYGYQVPFGPYETRPREGVDHRQVLAADKGPWYLNAMSPNWRSGPGGNYIDLDDPPSFWRPFNSLNHGGFGNGEGQNVLLVDGGVFFARLPAVGADNDNIYTLMQDRPWGRVPYNRTHGETPHQDSVPPYPGQDVFGRGRFATTDSLIFP
jgi:hypothetical protein